MNINVLQNADDLGRAAAEYSSRVLNQAIAIHGEARLLVSTGASQFETLHHLVKQDVDWTKVTLFHLDEYINLPEDHAASFRKYLRERLTDVVPLKHAHFVEATGDVQENIRHLTTEIRKAPIHLGLIGIGENTHLAFNDPPADFDTEEAYIVVALDDACKRQQVREGWFASVEEVPGQAISITVHQIMRSEVIVSSVPRKVKAEAILKTLQSEISNLVPSTILRRHGNANLFLDSESASLLDQASLAKYAD